MERTYQDDQSMVIFCYDRIINGSAYPNLALYQSSMRGLDNTWPRTTSLRLLMYMDWLDIKYETVDVGHDFEFAWYPVGLSWFDHDLDYFSLLSDQVKRKIHAKQIQIMFFYHEGDNPARIDDRLSVLCKRHGLTAVDYIFISANSACRAIENFYYFPDHEVFFNFVNRHQMVARPSMLRSNIFTMLSRTHKSWRASCMSDLHREGLLDQSYYSYHIEKYEIDDRDPFDYRSDQAWSDYRVKFLNNAPYRCDESTSDQQNDHAKVNANLYQDSFCHIVVETFYDVDQSDGVFLTEKTFKCIKFGQPFVIVGPANSLSLLREQGYRTFDHVIDNRYDTIRDNVQRWQYLKHTIGQIKNYANHDLWIQQCQDDLFHNQLVFRNRVNHEINTLLNRITCNQS